MGLALVFTGSYRLTMGNNSGRLLRGLTKGGRISPNDFRAMKHLWNGKAEKPEPEEVKPPAPAAESEAPPPSRPDTPTNT